MTMDILSDTLRIVRLTGAVFFDADLFAPWAFYSPPADNLRPLLPTASECLTLFHILDQGQCWISVDGVATFQMREGDAVVFPQGVPHTISSYKDPPAEALQTIPVEELLAQSREGVATITFSGQGEQSRFVCGYLQCDQRFNPLIGALPQVLWLRLDKHESAPLSNNAGQFPPWCIIPVGKGQWLETTLQHTTSELKRRTPGNGAMLARLSEIMFVEVLRRFMDQLPLENRGWLAAVRDPNVGRVLHLMHKQPERAWTVEDLASEAAMSRSTLAQRFASMIGESPIQYLAGWRIQLAKHYLRQTNLTIAEIASRTGYTSEVAFNHAFKREVGEPPVAWRKNEEIGVPARS